RTHVIRTLFPYTTLFRSFESVVNSDDKLAYFEDALREDPGLNTLMYIGGIERNILSTFPIESVEDLKGKVMRSGTGATELEWWRSEEHTSELQSRFDLVC